jgi:hypothetical protein
VNFRLEIGRVSLLKFLPSIVIFAEVTEDKLEFEEDSESKDKKKTSGIGLKVIGIAESKFKAGSDFVTESSKLWSKLPIVISSAFWNSQNVT